MDDAAPLCRLHLALGRAVACPAQRCAFWEPGGAVVPAACAVERLDLHARPDLAEWLLSVRERLEATQPAA
jgi:hypothetical protein